jgi:glutaminyl-peptide cyclotransferase
LKPSYRAIALAMLFGSVVPSSLRAQEVGTTLYPYHDAHIHAEMLPSRDFPDAKLRIPIFDRPGFLGGLVISSSYSGSAQVFPNNEKLWVNREISDRIQSTNNYLLCGTYNRDLAVADFLEPCLKLPNAIGAKMREVYLKASETNDPDYRLQLETFTKVLQILDRRKSILLVHFDRYEDTPDCEFKGSDDCLYGNAEDTRLLIDLLTPYRNVTLIIAHSGTRSFIGLDGLVQISKSPVADRVYVETSAGFSSAMGIISWGAGKGVDQAKVDRIIAAWKEFGIERILYGTDIVPTGFGPLDKKERDLHQELIRTSSLLTDTEKRLIFKDNYEALIRKLGPPHRSILSGSAEIETSRLKTQLQKQVKRYEWNIVRKLRHDTRSFTEGLLYFKGKLYESTGKEGESTLRRIDARTGKEEKVFQISDEDVFAEGLARWGNRLIQLTWEQKTAFVYDLGDFSEIRKFSYDTEGWGLTSDGRQLIMSDGSDVLYFRNPFTFEVEETLHVSVEKMAVEYLNELEYVDGRVYANIWTDEDLIVEIDPSNGNVTGYLDASLLRQLLPPMERTLQTDLNGIAYNEKTKTFFLTGKHWPFIFEIEILDH